MSHCLMVRVPKRFICIDVVASEGCLAVRSDQYCKRLNIKIHRLTLMSKSRYGEGSGRDLSAKTGSLGPLEGGAVQK